MHNRIVKRYTRVLTVFLVVAIVLFAVAVTK